MPKDPTRLEIIEKLRREVKLSQLLAGRLPSPVPALTLHELSDGTIFSTHRLIEGVALWQLQRPLAANFAATMGRFLRAFHAVPAASLADIGFAYVDGPTLRQRHIETYETTVRRVFSLISCEARIHVQHTVEALINDAATYDYEPALIHADLDSRNVLVDPETGEMTAVIDFGDAEIANPLSDYGEVYTAILQRFGAESQLPDLLAGSVITAEVIERRAPFSLTWWPLKDILFGLDRGEDDLVETAIRDLSAVVPVETRC
jgi:aminoglycoside phosphotransferase (APT) family kinase protein